jgi:osmotically-inducible protein OsmY
MGAPKRWRHALTAVGAVGSALVWTLVPTPSAGGASTDSVTDIEITRAIELELMSQAMLLFHHLDVGVADGIVTLRGKVDSLLDEQRALEVARSTRGVRGIVDRIEVEPVERSDADLARDLEEAIEGDPALEACEIRVRVVDGRALLSGVVDSWQEKRFALQVASGVPGLAAVSDALDIDPGQARSDAEIREDVERRLASDIRVDAGLIEVDVADGAVNLRGVVGSAGEREQARSDAWVSGATSVDASTLEVRWWARDDMRQREPRWHSDAEIARAIRDALGYDPRVAAGDVSVAVEDGEVTLSGTVRVLRARLAAEEDARNTLGTERVRNLLKVRNGPPPDDGELAGRVEAALRADPWEQRHEFRVSVDRGRVTLEGRVDSSFDERRAEAIASGVEGVKDVTNRVEVAEQRRRLSDAELQAQIRDELFWDARVDEAHVRVEVEDGVATLSGWVDDWRERGHAADNALQGGAIRVRNHLDVEPGRR